MKDEITPNEYQRLALRTESLQRFLSDDAGARFGLAIEAAKYATAPGERVIHAIMGIGSEAGELQDALKRHLFYGKPIDRTNLKEECGDLLWYIALLLDAAGFTMAETMRANITKLQLRYPGKFNFEDALNRDLEAERAALKGDR